MKKACREASNFIHKNSTSLSNHLANYLYEKTDFKFNLDFYLYLDVQDILADQKYRLIQKGTFNLNSKYLAYMDKLEKLNIDYQIDAGDSGNLDIEIDLEISLKTGLDTFVKKCYNFDKLIPVDEI